MGRLGDWQGCQCLGPVWQGTREFVEGTCLWPHLRPSHQGSRADCGCPWIPFANQFKIFTYGERLVDRVDFEELALKGVDPSMGPKMSRPRSPSEEQKKTALVRIAAVRRMTASDRLTRTRFRSSIPVSLGPHHWLTSKPSLRDEHRGIARDSTRGCYCHR